MNNNNTKRLVFLFVPTNCNLLFPAITNVQIAARIVDGVDNLQDLSFGDLENVTRNLNTR